ncbi:aminoglycoside phosphotransferase [Bifidobacterium sp. 82T24]|uniref:phosphotransferase n=1 Tax=Bifidobacterium pluvialisilvae TaxID=2834436 RepID=UPI001C572357|nr:phosphotransferase [Bifidobacterium pluvialisilvae]MBW3087711.1 aminoglycoside phosphotransferase [Bifidobacterium pluvialisilvae]
MAALASAAMPNLAVASTRESEQYPLSGADGIDTAVVTDTTGREFDVSVSDTTAGKKLLLTRADSSAALLRAKEPAGLGFALERTVAFQSGEHANGPTGSTAVLITVHNEGFATPLDQLTESQCVSVGTAIGAIHRLRPAFLEKERYPSFSSMQIRNQLVSWIARLKEAGHVPDEITSSWDRIVATEGLWAFHTCPVHGGFDDGDILFSSTGLNAIYHWSNMQVNDPARDLAWIFSRLDSKRRNNVLSAYARLIGSRLDDLIMLRASLWLQMEQVGDFIRALDRADNDRIIEFKAQVERLAHQLSVRASKLAPQGDSKKSERHPSTITVGTLLENDAQDDRQAGRRADRPGPAPAAEPRNTPQDDRRDRDAAQTSFPPKTRRQRPLLDEPTDAHPQAPESKTDVVTPPDVKSDDTRTVALPRLTEADFDDEGNIAPDGGATVEAPDDNHVGGHPTGYVSLIGDASDGGTPDAVDADSEEPTDDSDGSDGNR